MVLTSIFFVTGKREGLNAVIDKYRYSKNKQHKKNTCGLQRCPGSAHEQQLLRIDETWIENWMLVFLTNC